MNNKSKDFALLDYAWNGASRRLIKIEELKLFVERELITKAEFTEITGEEYEVAVEH